MYYFHRNEALFMLSWRQYTLSQPLLALTFSRCLVVETGS